MTGKQAITVPILLLILFCTIVTSCEQDTENYPVGEDWINLDTKVYYIDTLAVKSTTFKFDSIAVSNTTRLLIGAYTDPVFGYTESKIYTQLSNSTYSLDRDAVFDSIALILKYDTYFYNDTIPVQKIFIHEVIDDIEPDDDADSYYNTTNISINDTPIATKEFIAKPNKDDSLHISVSNTFGKTLFENIRDDKINNSDEFLKTYKGILIKPDANNTAILGILKTSYIRIYYTDKNEFNSEASTLDMSFDYYNSFHNISSNRQSTNLESLTDQETYLPSASSNNNTYMQAGTGIATRIDIPNLESLYDIAGTGIIINASMKISIKQNTSTDLLYTDDSLNIYIVDKDANIIGALTDTQGNTVLGMIDEQSTEFNIITYSFDVKYFLNLKLTEINGDNLYLAIYPKDYNQSINRYILNDETASNNINTKLELIYAVYD